MKKTGTFLVAIVIWLLLTPGAFCLADDWTNINGTISFNGTPVCAMVLANGQHVFSCSGDGSFNMDVPMDPVTGRITLFVFCSGLSPFNRIIYPAEGQGMHLELDQADAGAGMDVACNPQPINSAWVRLEGTVSYDGEPVCAMVLSNGQHMFTCSGDGSFSLDVPFNPQDGSVTLFGFCSGLPPYRYDYGADQFSFDDDTDDDGYPINQGDCNDLDPGIKPGAAEICGDGIDQDCDDVDASCLTYEHSYSASATYTYDGRTLTLRFTSSDFPEGDGPPVGLTFQDQVVSITGNTLVLLDEQDEYETWQRNQGVSGDIVGFWTKMDGLTREEAEIRANGTLTYTAQYPTFAVPYGAMVIDGSYEDWKSNYRVYVDTDGPDCNDLPGLDLKEVYLAQDETFIYLRFVLNGPPATTFGYKFGNESQHIHVRWNGSNGSISYSNGLGLPGSNLPQSFVHIDGNQFECKFYKSDVLFYWSGDVLGAWLDQGRETVCRDDVDMPYLELLH